MRLFFAIELPDDVREAMVRAQEDVRTEAGPDDWRWTKAEMLHVTLAFLGNVSEERIEDVKSAAMQACAKTPVTNLVFGGLGSFPSWKSPKVLWVGAKEPEGNLAKLGERLFKECAGEAAAENKVLLHVTLARAKTKLTRAKGGEIARKLENKSENCGSTTVSSIVFIQSTAGQNGPVKHIPLATFALKS